MGNIIVNQGTAVAIATDQVGTLNYGISKIDISPAGAAGTLFNGTVGLNGGTLGTIQNLNFGTIAISDGSYTGNVLSGANGTAVGNNAVLVGGAGFTSPFSVTAAGTTPGLNVEGYTTIAVDIKTQLSGGGVQFQVSNDDVNWRAIRLVASDASDFSSGPGNSNNMYGGPLMGAKFFRLNITGSSGTAAGNIHLSSLAISPPFTGYLSDNIDGQTTQGNTSIMPVVNHPYVFNSSTFDRVRSANAATNGTGLGLPAAGVLGQDSGGTYHNLAVTTGGSIGTLIANVSTGTIGSVLGIGGTIPVNLTQFNGTTFNNSASGDNLPGTYSPLMGVAINGGGNGIDRWRNVGGVGDGNTTGIGVVAAYIYDGANFSRPRGANPATNGTGLGLFGVGILGQDSGGTYHNIAVSTGGSIGTIILPNIPGGTLGLLQAGTIQINQIPTSHVTNYGTLGTAGAGTTFGTIQGTVGAGTQILITDVSIAAIAGTPTVSLGWGTQALPYQGTMLVEGGAFAAGGGIKGNYEIANHSGTNGQLVYGITAGTALFKVAYQTVAGTI